MTEKIAIYNSGDKRLDYKRIWQFDDLQNFQVQLEKMGQFLRTEYAETDLEAEYNAILGDHSSVARVQEILSL